VKIEDIRLGTRYLPFRASYGISSANFTGETFLIATLRADDGSFGLADSVNSIPFGYESPQTMTHIIQDHLLPAIRGMDPLDMNAIAARMARATPGHPMAKAVIDIALHDLNARALGLPVHRLLGGAVRDRISYIGAVGISTTERMVAEAQDSVAKGCRTIKLKIGADPVTDLARVRAVRAAIGPHIRLRVDANQGCNLSAWMTAFRKMEDCDLEYIEQPLSVGDIEGTARLAAALDTPILIDEGVYSPEDLIGLIRARAVDAVNIKVLKTGLTGARAIAAIAEAAGLPIVVGSMFETGIGTAAGLSFAATLDGVGGCSECLFPLMLTQDVVAGAPYSEAPADASWPVPNAPGLGVLLEHKDGDAAAPATQ
jgi:L-alanine-DL-glutamate epimerase-like enolase superfamily enzyme